MSMTIRRGFASDNNSGIHPDLIHAIQNANKGHVTAYGDDDYTLNAINVIKRYFGDSAEIFFVLTGTAANVLSISSITRSYNAVICAETAHINVDECGAPEKFSNCKLIPVVTKNGKLTPQLVEQYFTDFGFEHHVQPKVISISQPTEMGTVYTPDEIKALSDLAKKNKMYVHMDGARLSNAAVHLNLSFKEFTSDCGVDVLSFGGTKNGMLFGESIIFFNPELAEEFKYVRKQGMQLASKMRFISAQFTFYLENEIWFKNASHANQMALRLYNKIKDYPNLIITQEVQSNAIFAIIPEKAIGLLQYKYFFYVWNDSKHEVRWMTSFDTTQEDIDNFSAELRSLLS